MHLKLLSTIKIPNDLIFDPNFIHFIQNNAFQIIDGILALPPGWTFEDKTFIDDKGNKRAILLEIAFIPICL